MRTESRGMRRNSGYGILQDECSVTADDDVGSATAGLHLQDGLSTETLSRTSIAVAPFLDSNKDERVDGNSGAQILEDHWSVSADAHVELSSAVVGAVNSHTLVGPSRDVNAFLDSNNGQGIGDSMDVDCPFPYVDALPEVSIARRFSNGISINEPGPVNGVGDLRRPWFSGFHDVTGKGKRKLYEIPATDPCESQPMNGDVCQTSFIGDRLAAGVSLSSGYVAESQPMNGDVCQTSFTGDRLAAGVSLSSGYVADAIMIPDTDLDGMMDVNSSLDHTSVLPNVPLPSVDVIGPRTRLSTGITINEPHPDRSMMETRNQRSQLSIDVVGKGKRKVDDIPGSYAIDGSFPECASPNRHVLGPLLFSSNHNAAQVGVGSSSRLGPHVGDGPPIGSLGSCGSHVLYGSASTTNERECVHCLQQLHTVPLLCNITLSFAVVLVAEVCVPASVSSLPGMHPRQPILEPQTA